MTAMRCPIQRQLYIIILDDPGRRIVHLYASAENATVTLTFEAVTLKT